MYRSILVLALLVALPLQADPPQLPLPADPWAPSSVSTEAEVEPRDLEAPAGRRDGQIHQAVEAFRAGKEAPVIKRSGSVIYPFDESQPVVRCSPLRACDIELQAGEIVTGVALGDTERWLTSPLESGDPDRAVPHVLVKPKAYDIATNLVIATTRRTYHVGLISPPRSQLEAGQLAYHRHVTFYYPDEMVQQWATREEIRKRQEAAEQQAAAKRTVEPVATTQVAAIQDLNFEYRVRHRRRVRWAPANVFDDGRHVYIQMPESIRARDLPALLVETADGQLAVTNYRVQGRWYIVDGLFEEAQLVLGVGKRRQKVRIQNRQRRA